MTNWVQLQPRSRFRREEVPPRTCVQVRPESRSMDSDWYYGWKGMFLSCWCESCKYGVISFVTQARVMSPLALETATTSTPIYTVPGSTTVETQPVVSKILSPNLQCAEGVARVSPVALVAINAGRCCSLFRLVTPFECEPVLFPLGGGLQSVLDDLLFCFSSATSASC